MDHECVAIRSQSKRCTADCGHFATSWDDVAVDEGDERSADGGLQDIVVLATTVWFPPTDVGVLSMVVRAPG